MDAIVISAACAIGVSAALFALERTLAKAWAERDITLLSGKHPTVGSGLRAALAAVAGVLISIPADSSITRQFAVAGAASALTSLLLLAIDTDSSSRKIPFEPCYAVTLIGLLMAAVGGSRAGWIAIAVAIGFSALVWAIGKVTSGLGMGDTRLILSVACASAWWIGIQPIVTGLFLACIAQLLVRAILVAKRLATRQSIKMGFLPFAPALALGVFLAIGGAAAQHFGPCDDWPSGVADQCISAQALGGVR